MNSKKDKYLSFFLIKREGNEIKEYNPDGTKNPWVSEEGSQAKWKKFNSSDCDNRISSARGDLAKSNIVVVFEYLLYFKSHAKRWKVYIFALLFFDTWIRKVARLCDVLQANWRVRIGLHVFFFAKWKRKFSRTLHKRKWNWHIKTYYLFTFQTNFTSRILNIA